MKKIYWVIVLIIVLGLLFFLGGKKNKLEAPAPYEYVEDGAPISNAQPVLGEEGEGVKEAIVVLDGEVAVKEFTITAKNFSFTPATIAVKKGDRIKITFKNTQGFHDFVIDEFGKAAKQAQAPAEEVLEFTADKTGSFEYYCSVGTHRAMGMKGLLVVSE
ncbi:hypothetical protein A2914_00350 [Candidatus Nomurabacteria bacterium RIFCSPLOWO2_01_FULL_41_21]|uniref:EfeO-type cupredoxin-like domain-containing protein n=2 Tax=Candidatus Nomuraibacteriota TaxID=1752729 RepID=A0A1F6V3E4_9BACT|nr:MAG: hypothetical protein A2733_02755 [Candidatus Nomurabacteria bacterium RIFCSPHIGHO2_01_FULL_40_20]OGI88804.1 MAG: hypothetical protein A2914_00350 [Candidatus Nomurabacteria bacterium RIFCSPLOWO2_01_FULL_41_21]